MMVSSFPLIFRRNLLDSRVSVFRSVQIFSSLHFDPIKFDQRCFKSTNSPSTCDSHWQLVKKLDSHLVNYCKRVKKGDWLKPKFIDDYLQLTVDLYKFSHPIVLLYCDTLVKNILGKVNLTKRQFLQLMFYQQQMLSHKVDWCQRFIDHQLNSLSLADLSQFSYDEPVNLMPPSIPPYRSLKIIKRVDRDVQPSIDEKFRLHLEGKTPAQMIDTLRTYRHLVDLVRFRTFILQFCSIGPIYEYHLTQEQFEFLLEMFRNFPEMVKDISNLSDVTLFISKIRVNSSNLLLRYIVGEVIKNIDEMSLDETFTLYKALQAIRPSETIDGSTDQLNLLNDDVIRSRYLLISNVAFRIETLHFDETDINTLCEVFRIINRELYAKEAIDILVKSIVSMSSYMRSKNSTDIIAGFTSPHGCKILKEVFTSGDKELIKRYTHLIDLSLHTTGRLTNSHDNVKPKSNRYITECFIRMLIKEGENFSSITFWRNFLDEIDFNRHKINLMGWQSLLTLVNRFRVYCPNIIDSFAPIVIQNAEDFIRDDRISPIPYIYLMAECYHKPLSVNWDKFINVLLHPKKLTEIPAERTLALISRLAILEEYNIVRNFDLNRTKLSLSTCRNIPQCKRLITFYSGLIQESNDSGHKWLVKRECGPFIYKVISTLDKDIRMGILSCLQPTLEAAFGGPEFVINGVWSKSGIFMSHLLVFRRGEYPVAIRNFDEESNSKLTYLNDISIPPEGKIVAVLPAYRYYYTNNSRNLRGKIQFKLRLMRRLGIIPVIADISEFDELPVHEKTHWLVTKIRTKIMENNSDAWEFWR
ncbi:uncharacterized protein LOC128392312 [Panonychus citri]|uniref:uncharacterized protein LOC128392312 n=1 Tax=Panonychus citri TaxID=50023 RepID=UPI00230760B3|nr:uncharacterized protein LOC128392312 [Panonychus citri]